MRRTKIFLYRVVAGVLGISLSVWLYILKSSNHEQGKLLTPQFYKQTRNMRLERRDNLQQYGDTWTDSQVHKMALLVPFRNCNEELKQFVPYMTTFLNNQSVSHRIYVINQVDELRFNRAALINIGFLESHSDCDYIAMHDVDLLPLNPKLNYSFPSQGPYHIASPEFHPEYHYSQFVGGILLMTRDHYEKVNGMSNEFWGWGREDDEFAQRISLYGFKVARPVGIKTGVRNTFRHIHNAVKRPRDQEEYLQNIRRRYSLYSGINDIQYSMESRNTMLIDGTPVTFINVHLFCDVKRTPWCLKEKPRVVEGMNSANEIS